jgi:hypothetical protein
MPHAASTETSVPAAPPRVEFFTAGGTMAGDAASYVPRRADDELFNALSSGEFCYVLTSRQVGKSSLMVRTAKRLRENGAAVALLDLTAFGRNLTSEQWYEGLRDRLARQLELEDEIEAYWENNAALGPLRRFVQSLRDVVLEKRRGAVVIFIDEIDFARSLPFPVDELFAAIRECHNRRTEDPEMGRLTFCLLGVASPSDLIRDTRTTPFNIGLRVELTDFTWAEADRLTAGLPQAPSIAKRLLRRVLYWTGGHPYLTQRLCRAVAAESSISTPAGVDRCCHALFLKGRAQESDDNLLFVRDRILRSEVNQADLLDLYRRALARRTVTDDPNDPAASVLRLSGIVRAIDGRLEVRNRIYRRVFDAKWARNHLPDRERLQQAAAYRRGVIRTAAVALVLIALVISPLVYAKLKIINSEKRAATAELNAQKADARAASAKSTADQAEVRKRKLQADAEALRDEAEDERHIRDRLSELEQPLVPIAYQLSSGAKNLESAVAPDLRPKVVELEKTAQRFTSSMRIPVMFQVSNTSNAAVVVGLDGGRSGLDVHRILPGSHWTFFPLLLDRPTFHVYVPNADWTRGAELKSQWYLNLPLGSSLRKLTWDGTDLIEQTAAHQ